MKFAPRQPHPPPERSAGRTTTTRFLRLQPAEPSPQEASGAEPTAALPERRETRSLSMPPETASIPSARTASQRVRLRLDPDVATQPLPEAQWPSYSPSAAGTAEPAAPVEETEPINDTPVETLESFAPVIEPVPAPEPVTPTMQVEEEAAAPDSSEVEPAGASPWHETAPAPPAGETPYRLPTEPIRAPSSWMQGVKRLTPPTQPVALSVRSGASSPISLSRLARGERAAARPGATAREMKREEAALPVTAASSAPAATESRPLPRPELRRPSPTPLAEMTRPEHSLGRGFWIVLLLVIILLAAVLYFFGVVPKFVAFLERGNHPPAPVAPRMIVYEVARRAMTPVEIALTGTIEPFQQTSLYARTTGYVRDWLVDMGDPVKAGQVLAELDTPDVDHQLTQARATADEAKARLALAQDEAKRWDTMAAAHAVSQQDADEKDSARDEAQAGFNAAQASVARLVDLELFKEIRAPYAGRITARNLEVGTLVASGPGVAGSELFRVAQTDPVRVLVQVPEASAPAIHAGLTARIAVDSFPDRIFNGMVVRDAGVLDGATHTLRTELRVANPDGALLPGAQAGVRLMLDQSAPVVLIPADTLIAKKDGLAVARLTETGGHDIVHFTPVKVGRDFGAEVEVLDNVREGDRLVSHPPADLRDGTAVNARPFDLPPIPSLLPPKPSAPRA